MKSRPPPELATISVFDSSCGESYVDGKQEVAFVPFGLDLFDRLAEACEKVEQRLEAERKNLLQEPDYSLFEGEHDVGQFVRSLGPKTQEKDLMRLAVFTDEDHRQLEKLEKELVDLKANDPAIRAKELTAKAGRYQHAATAIKSIEEAVGKQAVEEIRRKIELRNVKRRAANAAAADLTTAGILPGTGGEEWRALWAAARRFSQAGPYSNDSFPVTGQQAQCVLCQQALSPAASDRLVGFEKFIQEDVQHQAREAAQAVKQALDPIRQTKIKDTISQPMLEEVDTDVPELAARLRAFIDGAVKAKDALLALDASEEVGGIACPPLRSAQPAFDSAASLPTRRCNPGTPFGRPRAYAGCRLR